MSEIIPFRKGLKPQELVLRFLDSPGHQQDAEEYLKIFTSQKPENFAFLVLDEETVSEDLDAFIFDVRYLVKMSLFPVILVQASDETLEEVDIEHYFEKARMPVSFLSNDLNSLEKLEFIRNRAKKNTLALIHIEADQDLFEEVSILARTLKTRRILFLKKEGGLLDVKTDQKIPIVNLDRDKKKFLQKGILSQEQQDFLQACDDLMRNCAHQICISVVSPVNILKELFTVKGVGTLIQQGSQIKTFQSWDDVNGNGLKILLQNSYQKQIREEFFKSPITHFYVEEGYKGVALVQDAGEMAYLSKFAVGTEARGLGVGQDLWNVVTQAHPRVVWRSRPWFFINRWYTKQCDGLHRTREWTVFWKGLEPQQITKAIALALEFEDDFLL